MDFPEDQIQELKSLFPGAARYDEGSFTYFLLPNVAMPDGREPARTDLLLCPMRRDDYNSRLFFRSKVCSKQTLNWHVSGLRIIERNWEAFSWKTPTGLRLAQMVSIHLRQLQ